MGMAASQARYLGLAAKRTNCEYQGQQINQARMTLGSQSAELWNQMLSMAVPTVPNQADYVSTKYAFSDGQNSFEIIDMIPTDEHEGYNYSIKYRYFEDEIKGIEVANTNPQVKLENVTVNKLENQTITASAGDFTWTDSKGTVQTLTEITDTTELENAKMLLEKAGVTISAGQKIFSAGPGNYYVAANLAAVTNATVYENLHGKYALGNSEAKVADRTDVNVDSTLKKIAEDNPDSKIAAAINAGEDVFQVVKNGTIYYVCQDELNECINSTKGQNPPTISDLDKQKPLKQYYTSQMKIEKTLTDNVLLDDATGSGRFSSIKFQNNYNYTFDLQTETEINEEAYNQAMNQYNYDSQQYAKVNADINAKTSIIQQQDRTLELKLKQLDTEHTALQTEMEAVQKVMSKNVEETFKTFGG